MGKEFIKKFENEFERFKNITKCINILKTEKRTSYENLMSIYKVFRDSNDFNLLKKTNYTTLKDDCYKVFKYFEHKQIFKHFHIDSEVKLEGEQSLEAITNFLLNNLLIGGKNLSIVDIDFCGSYNSYNFTLQYKKTKTFIFVSIPSFAPNENKMLEDLQISFLDDCFYKILLCKNKYDLLDAKIIALGMDYTEVANSFKEWWRKNIKRK